MGVLTCCNKTRGLVHWWWNKLEAKGTGRARLDQSRNPIWQTVVLYLVPTGQKITPIL